MLEILQYATSGFWVFVGSFLLLCVAGGVVATMTRILALLVLGIVRGSDRARP